MSQRRLVAFSPSPGMASDRGMTTVTAGGVTARYVAVADGLHSPLRRALGRAQFVKKGIDEVRVGDEVRLLVEQGQGDLRAAGLGAALQLQCVAQGRLVVADDRNPPLEIYSAMALGAARQRFLAAHAPESAPKLLHFMRGSG